MAKAKPIHNIIVLLGPPGSGKGTQGKMLAQLLGYNYFSMGATLRQFGEDGHKLSAQVKDSIDRGRIIPNDWITQIIFDKLKSLPKSAGLVLDGFPRDIDQVSIFDSILADFKVGKVTVLFIDVPKSQLLGRLDIRKGQESRPDDDPAVIEQRFEEYDHKTFPLVRHFDRLHRTVHINGDQPIDAVHREIVRKLGL